MIGFGLTWILKSFRPLSGSKVSELQEHLDYFRSYKKFPSPRGD